MDRTYAGHCERSVSFMHGNTKDPQVVSVQKTPIDSRSLPWKWTMAPRKIIFHYKQVVFHFHVRESFLSSSFQRRCHWPPVCRCFSRPIFELPKALVKGLTRITPPTWATDSVDTTGSPPTFGPSGLDRNRSGRNEALSVCDGPQRHSRSWHGRRDRF